MKKKTFQLTLSAMFVALGVLFPMLFHGIGLGSVFLPLFWPLAAAAFFLELPIALAVAALIPIVSSLVSGMPPVSPPILQVIVLELLLLAGTTVSLYSRTKWGLFWPLLIGLFLSRIFLFLIVTLIAPLFGLPPKVFSTAMVIQGMPGVLAILILVPIIVNRIKHEPIFSTRTKDVKRTQSLL